MCVFARAYYEGYPRPVRNCYLMTIGKGIERTGEGCCLIPVKEEEEVVRTTHSSARYFV